MPEYTVDVTSPDGRIFEVDVNASSPREAKRLANNHIVAQYEKMENLDTTSNFDYSFTSSIPGIGEVDGQNPGTLGATMIAMGRTGDKILTGINDLFASKEEKERIKAEQRAADSAYAPVAEQYPVATFIGETIPYMTPIGGGIRGTVAAQTALGGIGYEEDASDQVTNAAVSGVLSAVPYGLGKAIKRGLTGPSKTKTQVIGNGPSQSVTTRSSNSIPEVNLLNPEAAGQSRSLNPRLIERADELGYKITPAHRTGNQTLMRLEESAASYPWTAGPYDKMKFKNQQLLNREAGKTIGLNTTAVTDDLLDSAHTAISNTFDELTSKGTIKISDSVLDGMIDVIDDADKGLKSLGFGSSEVVKLTDEIIDAAADGKLTTEQYQTFSSQIAKSMKQLMKGDSSNPDLAFLLGDIKTVLDDAVEESLGRKDLELFRAARKSWKNLMTLERPGILAPETGDISVRRLRNFLNNNDKAGYKRGRNKSNMYDIARMSEQFKDSVGDSGTATRSSIHGMIQDAVRGYGFPIVPGIVTNIANRAYLASPSAAKFALGNNRVGRLASGAASVHMDRPEDELEKRGYR